MSKGGERDDIEIRLATAADAVAISAVLLQSFIEMIRLELPILS
ncbi:MAG: hypothetical protein ABJA18_13190 [bacterium]